MSQDISMDFSQIRESSPRELVTYFQALLDKHPDSEQFVTKSLLACVERESLPPNIVVVWLSAAKCTESLLQALTQTHSVSIRKFAIKQFFRDLRGEQWEETWEAVGGTPGFLALLKDFSVVEVKRCLTRFSHWQNGPDRLEKQEIVTDLFKSLLPSSYPEAAYQSLDERPFRSEYELMVPGCTAEFVGSIIRDGGPVYLKVNSDILREHYQILRQECLNHYFGPTKSNIDVTTYFHALLRRAPDWPSSKPKFSESMAFSLVVLEELVSHPEVNVPFIVLTELIQPLIRRMKKRKVDLATTKEVLEMSVKFLLLRPHGRGNLALDKGASKGLMGACLEFWAIHGPYEEEAEDLLVKILRMVPTTKHHTSKDYSPVLKMVPKPLRYRLLRLLYLHVGDDPVDIDNADSLKAGSTKKWHGDVFFALPEEEAIPLLIRLQEIHPRNDCLVAGYGILAHPPSQDPIDRSRGNSNMLLNLLERGRAGVFERATASVENSKAQSIKSRDQSDREFHAQSALFFAISSGSLELYGETLIWARRFVRDQLTARTVFGTSSINSPQSLDLLSGIPPNLEAADVSQISQNIETSNRIIFELFETAVSALKEPSFWRNDWQECLDLISFITSRRMSCGRNLQKTLGITDHQFYNLVLKDTLNLAMRIETVGLRPEYEKLQLQNPIGFARQAVVAINKNDGFASPACLKFVDEYARQRDILWREFRRSLHPTVTVLPPLLPQGLTLSCMTSGFDIAFESAFRKTPFISSRAEELVFASQEDALVPIPEDEETRSAIGSFVDSFQLALQIYVGQGPATEAQVRAMRAWNRATENLSGRMTKEEALRVWQRVFLAAIPTFQVPTLDLPELEERKEWPIFPFDAEVGKYTEWNPKEEYVERRDVQIRQVLPLTYLDLTLACPLTSRPDISGGMKESYLYTPFVTAPSSELWSPWRLTAKERYNPAVREGLIVSALLYLERFIPDHKSVLATPFPSAEDVRYPDMWLDLSFLEPESKGTTTHTPHHLAFDPLVDHPSDIPPSLLQRLAEASFEALIKANGESDSEPHSSDAKVAALQELAFDFLHLLARSDRPSMATKLILRTVIEMPDSSSWHRKLLSIKFMKSLSAAQAKNLVQSFADSIQQQMKVPNTPQDISKPVNASDKSFPKPYVKITTIKYLAQLLRGAKFVPESFTVEILTQLFTTSSHIDVRVAIVENLMDILCTCQEETLATCILKALEYAVPIAGRLDERTALSENDWEQAEKTGILPTIFEEGGSLKNVPPILNTLMSKVSKAWKERWMKQIMLPTLEESTRTNTRWSELFTANHGIDFHALDLPLLPVKLKFFVFLVQRVRYIPSSLMDLYHSFVLTNISPSPTLAAFNAKLQDPQLRHLPEVKHWLSLYGLGDGERMNNYLGFEAASLLTQDWKYASIDNGITIAQIQRHMIERAEVLISRSNLATFDRFLAAFSPRPYPQTINSLDWMKNGRVVVEHILAHIDSLRTPEWQRNPKRGPKFLPSTLKPRLWLLPYPPTDATASQVIEFAHSVSNVVAEICGPGKLYHQELPEVKAAMKSVLPEYRAQVACLLGDLKADMRTADLLCVDIAREMFMAAAAPSNELELEVSMSVVGSWVLSENEGIRGWGIEAAKSEMFREK